MKNGKVLYPGLAPVDVLYELAIIGLDQAGGRIRIDGNPHPAHQFGPAPELALPSPPSVLITENGRRVEIIFTNSNGSFDCALADEAREALRP